LTVGDLVPVAATRSGLVLVQQAVEEKSNEIMPFRTFWNASTSLAPGFARPWFDPWHGSIHGMSAVVRDDHGFQHAMVLGLLQYVEYGFGGEPAPEGVVPDWCLATSCVNLKQRT
jgi:hypothetical protein